MGIVYLWWYWLKFYLAALVPVTYAYVLFGIETSPQLVAGGTLVMAVIWGFTTGNLVLNCEHKGWYDDGSHETA